VLDPDGRVAGRVADLTVRPDEQASPHLCPYAEAGNHAPSDLGSKVLAKMPKAP